VACRTRNEADRYGAVAQRAVANGAVAVCVEKNCAETRRAGTSCAETVPNPIFGISGVLLSENEAKPVVICCSAGGCYRLVHVVNFADFN